MKSDESENYSLCDCTDEDETDEEIVEESTFMQLFEHIGEATPQFTIGVVFYINNYDYVSETDFGFEVFGFLVTQTLISIILSAISILKGIFMGIKSYCKLKAWKTSLESEEINV